MKIVTRKKSTIRLAQWPTIVSAMLGLMALLMLVGLPAWSDAQGLIESRVGKAKCSVFLDGEGNIKALGLTDTTDDEMKSIEFGTFPRLKMVCLVDPRISDLGLQRLESAQELEGLDLE